MLLSKGTLRVLDLPSARTRRANTFAILMVLPAAATLILLIAIPLGSTFYGSFFHVDRFRPSVPASFVGLQNYIDVLQDRFAIISLGNTGFFVLVALSLEFLIGLGVALLLNEAIPAKAIFRTLLLFPVMVAPIVAALQWRWLYADQYGLINYLLSTLGIKGPLWLANPHIAMWSIIIVDVWMNFPFVMLVLFAGLTTVPIELTESAQIDGASYWQRLWFIVLPTIRPTILVVLLIRGMDAFRIFDTIYVLTHGGPGVATETISTYTYRIAFTSFNFEKASALSIIATIVLMLFSVVLSRLLRSSNAV